MSTTITMTTPVGSPAVDTTQTAGTEATQQSAGIAAGAQQGISLGQSVCASAPPPSMARPALSPPTMSASAMMLALMSLQTEISNEAVQGGLETCTKDQADVAAENQRMLEDSRDYFVLTGQAKEVQGAMGILNVILGFLFAIVAAVVVGVTAGAAAPLVVAAGALGVVASTTSAISGVLSLPDVQKSLSEQGSKIASAILTVLTVLTSVASLCCGVGAGKAASKAAGKAVKEATTDVAQKMLTDVVSNTSKIRSQKMLNAVNMALQSINATVVGGLGLASSTMSYEAAQVQALLDEHEAALEEMNAELDMDMDNVKLLMNCFGSMVQSTAEMLATAVEGQRAAAAAV